MDIELCTRLQGRKQSQWVEFLNKAGLQPDHQVQSTVLIWEGEQLIATGSRQENILKCIAVDEDRQGEGLTATLLTHLRQDAFAAGYTHLFLYTKPKNLLQFSSLFFYPVAQTQQVLLMEDKPDGIRSFLQSLPTTATSGKIGAAVMNCNPFTLGHRYLIETAARACDWLYVFVLSEDKSQFSAADRLALVEQGTKDIPNVSVLPTGPYLISSATFPTYFLPQREQAEQVQCLLDIEIFSKYFAPKFGITDRFVGEEPLSPMTNLYNQALQQHLPPRGITLHQIPRLTVGDNPVSASAVRALLEAGQKDSVRALVPDTTFCYLYKEDSLC